MLLWACTVLGHLADTHDPGLQGFSLLAIPLLNSV